ncbi:transposable element Tcb2 transposase [Trichonephila clavipes]|nr:transposable element Tcb2 transposase [Trichonephila clavipes]
MLSSYLGDFVSKTTLAQILHDSLNNLFKNKTCFLALSSRDPSIAEAWRVVGRLEGGQTQAEVTQAIGVSQSTTVSTQTVRNRLHGVGLYARRWMVCVRPTSRHRHDRMEWATEHVNWRRNEWSNLLFSDESRFSVHPDNRRIFIWRDLAVGIILRSCTKVSDLAVG